MSILITGGSGLVGHSFQKYDTIRIGSKDCDLRNFSDCMDLMNQYRPEKIIHLAAKVGGVKGNMDFVGEFFRDNTLINLNVLESARQTNVSKVLSLLSTCIYPDEAPLPLTEDSIHNGVPHFSNFGYAYAKRMLHIQSLAYRKQWGCNYIVAVPNNLYGEYDNFELPHSHVIPAIIRKVYEAKIKQTDLSLWGNGKALREFTYSEDIASILMNLLETYDSLEPINIGCTNEYSIKEIAEMIAEILDFSGKIIWDESMPTGQYRKPSNNAKFLSLYPNTVYTDIKSGLEKTCKWFEQNYPNVKGIHA